MWKVLRGMCHGCMQRRSCVWGVKQLMQMEADSTNETHRVRARAEAAPSCKTAEEMRARLACRCIEFALCLRALLWWCRCSVAEDRI